MFKLNQLLDIAKDENIIIEYCDLPDSVGGHIYMINDISVILINNNILEDKITYKAVLAEELGHYFTTTKNSVPYKYNSYRDKINIDKEELKALRWAANFLMPTDELLEDIKDVFFSSYYDLCEIYDVPEYLAKIKIEHMAALKASWELSDGTSLVLSNLPNIYLYKPITNMKGGM